MTKTNPLLTPIAFFMYSCFFNSSFVVFCKLLGENFSPYELAFYRISIIFLIALGAYVAINKQIPPFKRIHPLFVVKAILALLSMVTWFMTINHLPIAETIAISFSTPILTSVLAIIILKEKFTIHHLVSYITGLVGMYLIVSPNIGNMNIYALIGILSCFLLSLSFIVIKFLLKINYKAIEINYYGNLVMLPMAFILVFNNFSDNFTSSNDILLVITFGACIFCADFFQNIAYKKADINRLTPLMFTTIILGILYDYVIFDLIISKNVLIGSLVVLSGIVYMNLKIKGE